ncbi:hypothetical protein N7445_003247 [Penicillium cf. griseofulvum]|nr:hypothetical protein N7445_003247 [Penicillium cf. griseofulvum]
MSKSADLTPTTGQSLAQFTRRNIVGATFETTARYAQLQPVGVGVSGIVCSAKDQLNNQTVAIKKLCDPFKTDVVARHMFREVKLLRHLQHDNIINLIDIFISPAEDIYLVTDLMATNLHTILKTKKLDDQFIQYFVYQMMRGLKYLHSADVIHRDLKPSNILINENCDLKICDFGLARIKEAHMTGYVTTRYYRAPEIMLTWKRYNEKVDIWSAGCIFAEMILGRPLFPGQDHIDQFCVITQLLGSPPDSVIAKVTSQNTLNFVRSLPKGAQKPLTEVLPTVLLLEKMLQLDPEKRCSAEESLEMQYLAPYHDPSDEPGATEKFNWVFLEADHPADVWKTVLYSEVFDYHKSSGGRSTTMTPPFGVTEISS